MPAPNFIVIGAQKCGTEALYRALQQHPDVFMSANKEPSFFAMDGSLPSFRIPTPGYRNRLVPRWDAYLRLFDGAEGCAAIGEASAMYLSRWEPERTAARIRERIPGAKLVALLRQPADRAFSAVLFYRARDLETADSFEQALAAEPERIRANDFPDIHHRANGFYHAHLSRFLEVFPREQVLVHLHEDWKAEPGRVLQDTFRFLGVDEGVRVEVGRFNVTHRDRSPRLRRFLADPRRRERWPASKLPGRIMAAFERRNRSRPEPMRPETRRDLMRGYRDDILQLGDLLDRDLSHWLAEGSGPS